MVTRAEASKVKNELIRLMREHPTAKVVTDVGSSLFSGWGVLREVQYHFEHDAIELIFD
jgi:hypothetical protein